MPRVQSVEGSVVQIHPGPVVTTYEFKPDAGVKYSKITGLADDLCLAMQAESVLIDRIPGKSTVGIQIPNTNREQISLRELLESEAYKRSASKLTLALGKTIHGEPFVGDLATMPHLLIAGSTGTGKSVSVNAMLSSILFRATPDEVRLIMIDPKRLELGMYEEIPHLLTPVVVDPKQAANALRWAVREMEERYKTLAAVGVRNIEQYNRNLKLAQQENNGAVLDDHGIEVKTLPFIVVLIDELADLMMVAGNEVEESICRLAQMARAVGIHLILATQRPSVDVITGLIKANLPARISFRVSSKIDSRTILDGNGAEQLLGKGDMLYLPPASSRFMRLHGPYISEQESARLASFLRKQGKPTYDETHHRGRQEGRRRSGVREGRPLRRSGAHRRLERAGFDFVSAAPAAHRLQPRGAAGRHDGGRRARLGRLGGGRRQIARSARQGRLLRRSRRAAEVVHEAQNDCGAVDGGDDRGRDAGRGRGGLGRAHALHPRVRPGARASRPGRQGDAGAAARADQDLRSDRPALSRERIQRQRAVAGRQPRAAGAPALRAAGRSPDRRTPAGAAQTRLPLQFAGAAGRRSAWRQRRGDSGGAPRQADRSGEGGGVGDDAGGGDDRPERGRRDARRAVPGPAGKGGRR